MIVNCVIRFYFFVLLLLMLFVIMKIEKFRKNVKSGPKILLNL